MMATVNNSFTIMGNDLIKRIVLFCPLNMTEAETEVVKQTILSGWISTASRT